MTPDLLLLLLHQGQQTATQLLFLSLLEPMARMEEKTKWEEEEEEEREG
jgi:hypothetical protein